MKRCAFLTLDERGDIGIEDDLALAPMADSGWRTEGKTWRQAGIPWREFDAVIIRSTWDYWNAVDAFLDVLVRIDAETHLANPLGLVRWNLAKTYLRDLERAGAPIVPTLWPDHVDAASMPGWFRALGTDELVIKPVVGANGEDAYRLSRSTNKRQRNAIVERFPRRAAMIQPFMPAVVEEGEFSLFFFNCEFSHAILKVPATGEFRSQEERGADIRPIRPEDRLLHRAWQGISTLHPAPLYARIDLVRDNGDFRIMELELIEPSMYLRTDPEAPARFARAIDAWHAAGPPGPGAAGGGD